MRKMIGTGETRWKITVSKDNIRHTESPKLMQLGGFRLVAGGGFEPPTFGL